MKAALINQYNSIEWQEVPEPTIQPDEVLVKSNYASICGSDQHIFSGEFHPRTQLPLIPGHEFAGQIVETGSQVKGFEKDDRVVVDPIIWCGQCPACKIGHYPACTSLKLIGVDMDGGFGQYVAVPEKNLYKIDEGISDRHAALIEVLSIGFHASARASVSSQDTIAIWGAGKVGQCILQAIRTKTEQPVFMVDLLDKRLETAQKGYDNIYTVNPAKVDPIGFIREKSDGKGVDIAFEAVGHAEPVKDTPHPVRACVQSIRGAGKVVVLGLADDPAPLVMKELIWKEAQIIASRVSHGEFKESIDNLNAGKLKPDLLISKELPASRAEEGFALLENNPEDYLKILLNVKDA
jgi:2-desacetyl-2-hydroxyethyl bacteriochlorophyllide A dehydrogenase